MIRTLEITDMTTDRHIAYARWDDRYSVFEERPMPINGMATYIEQMQDELIDGHFNSAVRATSGRLIAFREMTEDEVTQMWQARESAEYVQSLCHAMRDLIDWPMDPKRAWEFELADFTFDVARADHEALHGMRWVWMYGMCETWRTMAAEAIVAHKIAQERTNA